MFEWQRRKRNEEEKEWGGRGEGMGMSAFCLTWLRSCLPSPYWFRPQDFVPLGQCAALGCHPSRGVNGFLCEHRENICMNVLSDQALRCLGKIVLVSFSIHAGWQFVRSYPWCKLFSHQGCITTLWSSWTWKSQNRCPPGPLSSCHVALSLVLRVQWSWARLGFPLSLKSEVQRYPVLPRPHPHWCRLGHSMERLSRATPLKTSECEATKDMAREVWGFPMNVWCKRPLEPPFVPTPSTPKRVEKLGAVQHPWLPKLFTCLSFRIMVPEKRHLAPIEWGRFREQASRVWED